MKGIKTFWSNLSVRFKLLIAFSAVILFVSAFNLYLNNVNYRMLDQFNETMTNYYSINELMNLVRSNREHMDDYIREMDEAALKDYERTSEAMAIQIDRLYDRFTSQEAYFHLNAISNSVDSYEALWQKSVKERRQGIDTYYEAYYDGEDIYRYTEGYIQDLLYTSLREGSDLYNEIAQEAILMRRISLGLIVGVFVFALIFGAVFANYLVGPIKKLALASREMADGNLNIDDVEIVSNDEVGVLADSFNTMSASIRDYVKDLEQKVVIEKKLRDEEVAIIRMEHLLQAAEFQALQSQVNPHFLFNTLNTISRMAMFEEADDTVKLIQALSNLLRYRIRSSEDMVTVEEELSLIHEYIFLQKMRFKERLNFEVRSDAGIADLRIPVFTLQPLVENAIIHGVEPKIAGGRVRIKVRIRDKKAVIIVTDTGVGISAERLKEILDKSRMKKSDRIGVANVYHRVKLHYGKKGHFSMFSREGIGTVVKLTIDRE